MAQFVAVKTWGPFPSSSPKRPPYTVQLNTTGIISCNCKGWAIRKKDKYTGEGLVRECQHTKLVIAQEGLRIRNRGQYQFLVDQKLAQATKKYAAATPITEIAKKVVQTRTPQETFAILIAEYETALDVMAKLDPADMIQAAPAVDRARFKVEAYMLLLEQKGIDGTAAYEAAQAKAGRIMQ